ncbi:esterase [Oceanobacter mangrovi]|uniref:esterase n=1 Tax=Oceanobacter mangrovi TaxID=2862510 RepID=UPI001C8D42B4|nr:esterase [Oceanobacter mangrovi]
MNEDYIVARPLEPRQLVLLYHGVGSHSNNLIPLGEILASFLPDAAIVSVAAPDPCDLGGGLQWFSVKGVTENNRQARVLEAMPGFLNSVRRYQAMFLVAPQDTVLIGFSQGAIMSLEAAMYENDLAGRVVSLSGRMATLPVMAPVAASSVAFSFIHGTADPVIAAEWATSAEQHLKSLGFTASLSLVPEMGHEINSDVLSLLKAELAQ